jgi:hypothetical protein
MPTHVVHGNGEQYGADDHQGSPVTVIQGASDARLSSESTAATSRADSAAHPLLEVGLVTVDSARPITSSDTLRYIWESPPPEEVAFPVPGNSTVGNVESSVTDHLYVPG